MKQFCLLAGLALAACDNELAREVPPTATPAPQPVQVPATPIPNKLKGTTLDRPTPIPQGRVNPDVRPPYVSPLEEKPK